MKLLVAVAGAALLAAPLYTSFAQDAQKPGDGGPCRADIERLCPDASGGRGAFQCLRDQRDEVSEACKEQLAEARRGAARGRTGAMRRALQACSVDLEKHCGDVERGEGRLGACLQEHAGDLSDPCREALDGLRRR